MENPDSKERAKVLTRFCAAWLKKLSLAFNVEIEAERVPVYAEALADLPLEYLDAGFNACLRECRFFPTVAEVRGAISKQFIQADQMHAEQSWDAVNKLFHRHWHPDVGFYGNPPALDEAAEWALRQIGGMRRIAASDIDHESFLRKEFIEAYKRYRDTGGYLAPTREQAAKLIDQLRRGELPPESAV